MNWPYFPGRAKSGPIGIISYVLPPLEITSKLGMPDTSNWLIASTKSLMPFRSSSREKKASRHIGFSLPISCKSNVSIANAISTLVQGQKY